MMGGTGKARPFTAARGLAALPVIGVGLGLTLIARFPTTELPQVVKDGDALAVAFGDARAVVAQMMIRKSDSYFHGGIDIDCHCEDCREGHCEEHHHETKTDDHHASIDPWRWIDSHIRAPQRHIHLDGEKAVELLPLYWAALRADPHDADAWTTAIFIAVNDLNDDSLAERLIAEAKANNPQSAEIAFAEGRYLRHHGDADEARRCFERAAQLLLRKGEGNWDDDDRVLSNLVNVFLDSGRQEEGR